MEGEPSQFGEEPGWVFLWKIKQLNGKTWEERGFLKASPFLGKKEVIKLIFSRAAKKKSLKRRQSSEIKEVKLVAWSTQK